MALKVWLPLNGDLKNIGADRSVQATFANPSYVPGKIGNALQISNKASSYMTIPSLVDSKILTAMCWVKLRSSNTFTAYADVLSFQAKKNASATAGLMRLECNTNAASMNWYANGIIAQANLSTVIPVSANDTWHHLALALDGTHIYSYVDGNLLSTQTIASDYTDYRFVGTFRFGDSGMYCDLNDVRIYDHCLSALEVKEISQGLVLHYKLNGQSGGAGENLISNSEIHTITANASNQYNYFWAVPTGTLTIGETYTFSTIAKITGTNAPTKCTVYNYHTNPNTGGPRSDNFIADGVTRDSFTFVANATGFICYAGNSGSTGGFGAEYKQLKLEKGSVATPWTPTSIEMGKDLTKVVDSSGYGNNGIAINSPSNIVDSKSRYNICTEFNGSNTYINAGTGAKVKDEITVAWWGYMDSWSSYTRAISCTEGGGWNFEVSSGKINFAMGTGTSSNTYKSCTSNTTLASLASGWHHFVGTYDGLTSNLYIDGILDRTLSCYTEKTPIYYHPSNSIIVGAEANAGNTAAGSYFNGKLSDIRIYATALSAEDIATLYHTPAQIDNLGSVHGFEINEIETSNLSDFTLIASNWVSDGVTATYSEGDMGPMVKIVPSSGNKRIYHNVTNVWKNGQSYIVSFIAKADANGAILRASRSVANFAPNFNLTTYWQKYYGIITSLTTTDGGTLSIDCQTSTNYYIVDIKLEEANKNLISVLENGVVKENWIDENNFNNNAKFLKETSIIIGNNFIEK